MTTRDAALSAALSLVVVLALSYATPGGRRVVRDALRGARIVSNATGDVLPALVLRMWRATPEWSVRVDVYTSGRLVLSGRDRAEVVLDRATAEKTIEAGRRALGDFNARGCDASPDGMNADLSLLVRGKTFESVCRDALDWPQGPWTRQLLRDIAEHLPAGTLLDPF